MKLSLFSLMLIAALPVGAASIDTGAVDSPFGPIGPGGAPTFGQAFTAPTTGGSRLTSFSFQVALPTALGFRAFVYEFDAANLDVTGPALYQSGKTNTTTSTAYQQQNFNTGGIDLTGGKNYLLVVTTLLDASTNGAGVNVGSCVFSGLQGCVGLSATSQATLRLYSSSATSLAGLATKNAFTQAFGTAAFTANFTNAVSTATPEPATAGMLGVSLVGFAFLARRRSR